MRNLPKPLLLAIAALIAIALTVVCVVGAEADEAHAQHAGDSCSPTKVIPLTGEEPPAKLHVRPPLAEPLASRGVVVIEYCAENARLMPVFGPNAVSVTPRIGHIHVRVDRVVRLGGGKRHPGHPARIAARCARSAA